MRYLLFAALALNMPGSAAPVPGARISISTLPLRFESHGDPESLFIARNGPLSVWLNSQGAVLHLRSEQAVRIELDGANASAASEPLDELTVRTNYFIGRDPAAWRRNVRSYGRVRFHDVWPGID